MKTLQIVKNNQTNYQKEINPSGLMAAFNYNPRSVLAAYQEANEQTKQAKVFLNIADFALWEFIFRNSVEAMEFFTDWEKGKISVVFVELTSERKSQVIKWQ